MIKSVKIASIPGDNLRAFVAPAQMEITLSNRPSPEKISFADHCFINDGVVVEFRVLQSWLKSGPAVFRDESQAAAYAKKLNRPYERIEYTRRVRVSWN